MVRAERFLNENRFAHCVGSGVDCSCPRRLYVAVELAHARFVRSANHRLLASTWLDGAVELFLLSWLVFEQVGGRTLRAIDEWWALVSRTVFPFPPPLAINAYR